MRGRSQRHFGGSSRHGGDEAALFAGDLVRMYLKHAEDKGWKHSWVGMSEGTVGGFKEAVIRLEGEGCLGGSN